MTPIPPRDNAATDCEVVPNQEEDPRLPDHIRECTCETHSGICIECNYKITIGPSGTEYGHGRGTNKGDNAGYRDHCPHRPSAVEPLRCTPKTGGRP